METYYEVTYTDKEGNRKRYTRDTVERGHYLYKSLVSDGMENVVLREVSANGIAQLRPYTPSKVKEEPKNIKPKFNVGEWVVNELGDLWHIDSFDKKNYQVSDGKGNYNYFPIAKQDKMRLCKFARSYKGRMGIVTRN